MSLALPSLVALTLLVGGAVAALPAIVAEPLPRRPPLPALPADSERLRIVEGPGDRWYLNGVPIRRTVLHERLRRSTAPREVRYLPSAALPIARVADSLRWLRRQSRGPVGLELLPDPQ